MYTYKYKKEITYMYTHMNKQNMKNKRSGTNLKIFLLFGLKSIFSFHILALGTLDLRMESFTTHISSNSSRASFALSSQYFF